MVTNVTPTNAPTASVGKEIHVQGASFGFYDSTPMAKVVSTDCPDLHVCPTASFPDDGAGVGRDLPPSIVVREHEK